VSAVPGTRRRLPSEIVSLVQGNEAHDRQVFAVAAHLEPRGCFVIEAGVPRLQRLPPGEEVAATGAVVEAIPLR